MSISLTNVVLLLGLMQSYMLPNQNTDAYAAKVKPIQKLMDLWQLQQANPFLKLPLQLSNSHSHDWYNMSMPVVDVPQQICELLLVVDIFDGWEVSQVLERLHIPISHLRQQQQSQCYKAAVSGCIWCRKAGPDAVKHVTVRACSKCSITGKAKSLTRKTWGFADKP